MTRFAYDEWEDELDKTRPSDEEEAEMQQAHVTGARERYLKAHPTVNVCACLTSCENQQCQVSKDCPGAKARTWSDWWKGLFYKTCPDQEIETENETEKEKDHKEGKEGGCWVKRSNGLYTRGRLAPTSFRNRRYLTEDQQRRGYKLVQTGGRILRRVHMSHLRFGSSLPSLSRMGGHVRRLSKRQGGTEQSKRTQSDCEKQYHECKANPCQAACDNYCIPCDNKTGHYPAFGSVWFARSKEFCRHPLTGSRLDVWERDDPNAKRKQKECIHKRNDILWNAARQASTTTHRRSSVTTTSTSKSTAPTPTVTLVIQHAQESKWNRQDQKGVQTTVLANLPVREVKEKMHLHYGDQDGWGRGKSMCQRGKKRKPAMWRRFWQIDFPPGIEIGRVVHKLTLSSGSKTFELHDPSGTRHHDTTLDFGLPDYYDEGFIIMSRIFLRARGRVHHYQRMLVDPNLFELDDPKAYFTQDECEQDDDF